MAGVCWVGSLRAGPSRTPFPGREQRQHGQRAPLRAVGCRHQEGTAHLHRAAAAQLLAGGSGWSARSIGGWGLSAALGDAGVKPESLWLCSGADCPGKCWLGININVCDGSLPRESIAPCTPYSSDDHGQGLSERLRPTWRGRATRPGVPRWVRWAQGARALGTA